MNDRRLLLVLAGVFGTLAVLLLFLGVTVTPVAIGVALPFAGVAYLLWYHATGRLEARAHERARTASESGDAGGRSRQARQARADATRERATAGGGGTQQRQRPRPGGMTRRRAREILGVDADASEADVQRAYRERVKAVHPDRGGDPDAFRRVQRAYERLRE